MKKIFLSLILLLGLTAPSWAVVSSTISQNEYACNSSNTAWNYTFPIILSTDIQVYTIDSMGNATLQTSNFSVNIYTQTVTYPVTGSPCATGYSLLLERIEPFTQLVAASNQGPSPSPVVMTMSDKLTMLAQQLSNNSVQSSPGTVGTVVFPAYTAGNLIAWSSTLNQLANVANPSAVAQWSLSGANISYNVGNVSTTNNMTANNFIGNLKGNLTGNVNWVDISPIASSSINWNDIGTYATINAGAINWPNVNSNQIGSSGINWNNINTVGNLINSTGINWSNVNSLSAAPITRPFTVSPSSVGAFTISGLLPATRYKLILNLTQNTSAGIARITFNGDSGSHYNFQDLSSSGSSVATDGWTASLGYIYLAVNSAVGVGKYIQSEMLFQTAPGNNNIVLFNESDVSYNNSNSQYLLGFQGGYYNGSASLSSITLTTSAGTVSGTATIYQLN